MKHIIKWLLCFIALLSSILANAQQREYYVKAIQAYQQAMNNTKCESRKIYFQKKIYYLNSILKALGDNSNLPTGPDPGDNVPACPEDAGGSSGTGNGNGSPSGTSGSLGNNDMSYLDPLMKALYGNNINYNDWANNTKMIQLLNSLLQQIYQQNGGKLPNMDDLVKQLSNIDLTKLSGLNSSQSKVGNNVNSGIKYIIRYKDGSYGIPQDGDVITNPKPNIDYAKRQQEEDAATNIAMQGWINSYQEGLKQTMLMNSLSKQLQNNQTTSSQNRLTLQQKKAITNTNTQQTNRKSNLQNSTTANSQATSIIPASTDAIETMLQQALAKNNNPSITTITGDNTATYYMYLSACIIVPADDYYPSGARASKSLTFMSVPISYTEDFGDIKQKLTDEFKTKIQQQLPDRPKDSYILDYNLYDGPSESNIIKTLQKCNTQIQKHKQQINDGWHGNNKRFSIIQLQ